MSRDNALLASFLKEVMSRRRHSSTKMAAELGVSHAAMSRWLSGENVPNTRSCQRLAKYSGVPVEKILSVAGHLPTLGAAVPAEWPEFREYAHRKYRDELDEDLITMIEDLIERRRRRRYDSGGRKSS